MEDFTNFWRTCVGHLAKEMDPYQFATWIPLLTTSEGKKSWHLYAPSNFILNLVKENCLSKINELKEHFKADLPTIILEVGLGEIALQKFINSSFNNKKKNRLAREVETIKNQRLESVKGTEDSSQEKKRIPPGYEHTRLNPELNFDNLVIGTSNQVAHSIGIAITKQPGKKDYNPFFVYGATGLGKTHLVQAIANRLFSLNPNLRIRYIHADKFVNDYVRHVRRADIDGFKKIYQDLGLLILDDVQFIAGKEKSMEEFFYLFNHLLDQDKQIILTADCLPARIDKLDKRLISRFSGGLTTEIDPPELKLRVAILQKKASNTFFELPEEIAFFIAQHIKSNVRELEGALNRVRAHTNFTKQPLTIELAKSALKDILAQGYKPITIDEIQRVVAEYYSIKVSDLKGKQRKQSIVRPRQVAMSLAKELTEYKLPAIGQAFGKDHSTVIYAHRAIAKLRLEDSELDREYNILVKTLSQ